MTTTHGTHGKHGRRWPTWMGAKTWKAWWIACWMGWALGAAAATAAPRIERIEPPNWWVGMRHPQLQLLLEGPGLAAARATLAPRRGVQLLASQPGDGANHLFLTLRIAPDAPAGPLTLLLRTPEGATLRHEYALWARTPGSAQRRGFGPQDAVYLVVPDRFAQGRTPSAVAPPAQGDFSDRVDRADPLARHGGDLAGLRERLDYIAGMGFTMLWCTPLTENAMPRLSYHGYAPTDLYRVDARFGRNEDYRTLVAEARARGIGVIHDIVLNHIGDQHRWMRDAPTRDWINPQRLTNHSHVAVLDPHGAPSDRRAMVDGWFVPTMPDLNTRQPLLAEYLIQNSIWWVEWAGLAGIREDTWSYADKAFLQRWVDRLLAEYPRFSLVGEEMSDHAPMVAYWQRGQHNHDGYRPGMPSMMDFPLVAALRKGLRTPEGRGGAQQGFFELYQALAFDFVYPDPSMLMLFDGNHDTTRLLAELEGDEDLARMALAFVATVPRVPQFFYGTEVALRGPYPRDDGRLRADMPGGFPGDRADAFSGAGLSEAQRSLQQFLRTLLTWRKQTPLLHHGRLMQYLPQDGQYVYFRHAPQDARERVLVAFNKNAEPAQLALERFAEMLPRGTRYRAQDVLSGEAFELGERLAVPARGLRVLALRALP